MSEIVVDVAIIGAGTAGLNAMGQVRRAKKSFVLIDGGPLGTTCARVGCMPSKSLIQMAHFGRVHAPASDAGGTSVALAAVLERVRAHRDLLTGRVKAKSTDKMGSELMRGHAKFIEPNRLQVGDTSVRAGSVVIACGTRPIVPAAWEKFGDRLLTTDSIFEQDDLPSSMAVIGLGVIGLEIGQALSNLGVKVTGVDMLETIAGIDDPAVRDVAIEVMGRSMPLWLGAGAELSAADGQIALKCGKRQVVVDKVLASMGRASNLSSLALENTGVQLDERGVPVHDPHTMRCGDSRIFIAGDATGDRQILHEAADEGRIAGFNSVNEQVAAFARKIPVAITFSDPNICAVGARLTELESENTVIGQTGFKAVGRAVTMEETEGLLRVYADKRSGVVLGASMIAPRGEHLAQLLAWSIGNGETAQVMLCKPFYHPTIEEALQGVLRDIKSKLALPASATPSPIEGLHPLV